jgi:hypothetical protein
VKNPFFSGATLSRVGDAFEDILEDTGECDDAVPVLPTCEAELLETWPADEDELEPPE